MNSHRHFGNSARRFFRDTIFVGLAISLVLLLLLDYLQKEFQGTESKFTNIFDRIKTELRYKRMRDKEMTIDTSEELERAANEFLK